MKLNRFVSLLSLISGAFLLASPCGAQPLVYETTQANAIARAKAEGKMILTEFGRPDCSDCIAMRANFELLSPPLKQWILASCVLWNADIDHSTEWSPYASGLSSFALPLMCFVDPAKPGTYKLRKTGLIPANTFLIFLQGQAKNNLPLVVTNLPGAPLANASFVVKGIARTNAAFSGSISNAAITAVMWRLNGTGPFQAATGTTVWSQQVSLPSGTNTFESYVQYEGAKNSWTNRVTLINLGTGGTNKVALTITANAQSKTYGTTINLGTTAFTTSGLQPGDTVGSVTLTASGGTAATAAAGPYTITPSAANGTGGFPANYNVTYVPGTLTVNKAVLTVTANDASKSAGAPNPTFTASYSGFFNADTASVLSGSPLLATTATTGSGPGSYPITVALGTLSATNYSFSFVNGTLTVNPTVSGDTNNDGKVDQAELNAVLANYWASSPPYITNTASSGKTNFTFTITNFTFRVQFITNLNLPPLTNDWQDLGQAVFQFTDPNAGIGQQRYYRLVAP